MPCSIQPWLSVDDGAQAIAFYQSAFGATEVYRLSDPGGGLVARLSVEGAEFWLSAEPPSGGQSSFRTAGGVPIRLVLIVADPDTVFAQALAAGAGEISPVSEGHGWRVGRFVDPFGHNWEIGRPLGNNPT